MPKKKDDRPLSPDLTTELKIEIDTKKRSQNYYIDLYGTTLKCAGCPDKKAPLVPTPNRMEPGVSICCTVCAMVIGMERMVEAEL